MAKAVPPPDAPGVFRVEARQARRRDPQQGRQPGGQEVGRVVQMGRRPAKVDVALVLVAHHAVHGVHRLIGQAQGRAPDQQVEQGGRHPVREVFGHRLDGGFRHSFGGEGGGVPPHDPADGFAGGGQVVPGQLGIHLAALVGQAAQGQRLPAPQQFQRKARRRVQPVSQRHGQRRHRKRAQGQRRRQHPAGRPFPCRRGREQPAQQLFQRRDGPAHPHHRVRHPGGVGQQQVQPEAPQHRQGGQHPASPARRASLVYWTGARHCRVWSLAQTAGSASRM